MRTEKFKGVLLSTLVIASVVALALSLSSSGSASVADFNFFPEQPMAGETVYFFDSSYGDIVEWYWWYCLWGGGDYWTLGTPFGNGEQNPTLTLEFEGGCPEKVMIGLEVTDAGGAVDYVTRIIQVGMSPPPPNQPPIADFNFSPEQPRAGEKVYFFDSSEDPDGYIVEWYWSYSLIFGGTPTLPMPFDDGEQNKQNPTLTLEFEGGCPEKVQINLQVTDDDGAVDYVSRIIYIYWVPCVPPWNCLPTWTDPVRLEAISTEENAHVKVRITFSCPCFDVDWGSVTRIDNLTFSADAKIWAWTGYCIQIVTDKSYIYDLDGLPRASTNSLSRFGAPL